MARSVALVLDHDFGAKLENLAFRVPVWIVETPRNRVVAEDAWRRATEWPHISVTLFRAPPNQPMKADWASLLEIIELHEPSIETVEVFGSPLTLPARAAFDDAGFVRLDETETGFRARRRA